MTLPADAHKVSPYQGHLRIIDDELWRKVQNRRTRLARQPAHKFRAPKRLLSGLLRCGSCGGSMVIHDTHRGKSRIRCSNMREAGICDNRIRPYLHHIEQKVCREMTKQLRDPRLIELYVDEFNKDESACTRPAVPRAGAWSGDWLRHSVNYRTWSSRSPRAY